MFMYSMYFLIFILIMLVIMIAIYFINYFFSMIKVMNYSKLIPFECGFDYFTNPNLPFSLSFYIINLMFLIFDIEIVMLLPVIFNLNYISSLVYMIVICMFLIFMLLTMMIELMFKFLSWTV